MDVIELAEDLFVRFVDERVPTEQWKDIQSPDDILRKIDDDDEEEMKNFIWEEVIGSVNWRTILREIRDKANRLPDEDTQSDEEVVSVEEEEANDCVSVSSSISDT